MGNVKITLKDVTQLVHARLNYFAQTAQLSFKWRDFLRYVACDVSIDGT